MVQRGPAGDFAPIVVRAGANVQDCSILHAPPGIPTDVGPGATMAHGCVVHGVHVGARAVIANHCTVLDGAVMGARSLVAAHSLVIGGTKIPDEVVVTGAPAKVRGPSRDRRRDVGEHQPRRLSGPGPSLYGGPAGALAPPAPPDFDRLTGSVAFDVISQVAA